MLSRTRQQYRTPRQYIDSEKAQNPILQSFRAAHPRTATPLVPALHHSYGTAARAFSCTRDLCCVPDFRHRHCPQCPQPPLLKLCWIWEWDGITLPSSSVEDDNPFLEEKPTAKDWTRGAMGVVIGPATHHSRGDSKRFPAYGIGIEVDMHIAKGMAAVARWTGVAESRREVFREKLNNWVTVRAFNLPLPAFIHRFPKLHAGVSPIPPIPCADLPRLSASTKTTALTRDLASLSPKSSVSPFKLPAPPSSPSSSPSKPKARVSAIPFPLASAGGYKSPAKSSVVFPQTPSSRLKLTDLDLALREPLFQLPPRLFSLPRLSTSREPRQRQSPRPLLRGVRLFMNVSGNGRQQRREGREADPRPTLENGPRRTAKKLFVGPPRWCRRKRLDDLLYTCARVYRVFERSQAAHAAHVRVCGCNGNQAGDRVCRTGGRAPLCTGEILLQMGEAPSGVTVAQLVAPSLLCADTLPSRRFHSGLGQVRRAPGSVVSLGASSKWPRNGSVDLGSRYPCLCLPKGTFMSSQD
ncbi:hypothetical protein B0H13DRAFT_1850468 [Mycena leptocephala]|nr:hypothetical protein B0H13DRAFT_1850468 [Mycena leptocephala]